jgi:Collagen triple helix repeat (20 copies)
MFTASTAGQYVTLDVTSLVQNWITTPATNFGVALSSGTANLLLDSKENDETAHPATLDITITSTGAQGPQGIPGPIGPQGIQGVPGANGAQGPAGPAGANGAPGAPGANGTIGAVTNWSSTVAYQVGTVVFCASCSSGTANGSSFIAIAGNLNVPPGTDPTVWQLIAQAGAIGAQGIMGPQGTQGVQGAPGPIGPLGPIGITGPIGATGTLSAVTNWNPTTLYTIGQVVFCAACTTSGSSYIALALNSGIDPSTGGAIGNWQLIAQAGATGATGPQGAMGTQGTQGIQGVQGNPGAVGAAGATGATGPPGATGTLSTVTDWSPIVTFQMGQVVFCTACSTNGSSFISLINNNLNNNPPATQGTDWQLIAQAGTNGTNGTNGMNGSPGATGATGSVTTGFVWSSLVSNEGDPGPFFVTPLASDFSPANNSQLAFIPASAACTVRSLTVNAIVTKLLNPIEADTMTFTVVKNDAATTMSCSIATTNGTADNTILTCADPANTFTVVQGDRISMQFTETIGDEANQFINAGTTLVCD